MMEWIEKIFPNVIELGWEDHLGQSGWRTAIQETLYMTAVPFLIGGVLGLLGGLFLVLTGPKGIMPNRFWYQLLDKLVSVFRALPFIILLALVMPVTRALLHTGIGPTAALVPLSLAVFPFFARQVQVVLTELDGGVIEAAQASGANLWDIIGVYLREGLPDLIRVSTVTLQSLVGETAMAGAIGAGGLGTVALSYGFRNYRYDAMYVAIVLILLLIMVIQFTGDTLSRKISKR